MHWKNGWGDAGAAVLVERHGSELKVTQSPGVLRAVEMKNIIAGTYLGGTNVGKVRHEEGGRGIPKGGVAILADLK